MKINVFLSHFDDAIGYDLKILHEDATIQNYLDALNQFQESHVDACKGCDGCCFERIPLTSLDVYRYLQEPKIPDQIKQSPTPLTTFIHSYCHVVGTGPIVDIRLKRKADQSCVFLDQKQKICQSHLSRSFVCQSFVCLPHGEEAGQLRDTLLNVGEDDLVHHYLQEAKEKGVAPIINENNDATPLLENYPDNIFTGNYFYHQVRIKDVVPENLWQELYIHSRF